MPFATAEQAVDAALDRIIAAEGGWSDHNADKGGPTNHGVTLETLQHLQPGATIDDLRTLTVDAAKQIFLAQYIRGPGIDRLPPCLIDQVADISVNCGPPRAIRLLQLALGILSDGIVGPQTIAAAQESVAPDDGMAMNNALCLVRAAFYRHIVSAQADQAQFLDGWLTRAGSFHDPVLTAAQLQESGVA